MRLHRLEDQIGRKEEREEEQRFLYELNHAWAIASFGQLAAQAPQSTHLSGSMVYGVPSAIASAGQASLQQPHATHFSASIL